MVATTSTASRRVELVLEAEPRPAPVRMSAPAIWSQASSPPQRSQASLDEPVAGLTVREVGHEDVRPDAERADLVGDNLGGLARDDRPWTMTSAPRPGESKGDRPADPGRRAEHGGPNALQFRAERFKSMPRVGPRPSVWSANCPPTARRRRSSYGILSAVSKTSRTLLVVDIRERQSHESRGVTTDDLCFAPDTGRIERPLNRQGCRRRDLPGLRVRLRRSARDVGRGSGHGGPFGL